MNEQVRRWRPVLVSLVLILGLAPAALWAQAWTAKSFTQEFGAAAGSTTGAGFSYRYWPQTWGVQVTALPLIARDTRFADLGVTGLYVLDDNPWDRFFGYFGGNLAVRDSQFRSAWGAGLGLELVVFRNLGFDLQSGLTYRPQDEFFGPSLEVGAYYRM